MRTDSRRRWACVFAFLMFTLLLPSAVARGQEVSGDLPTNSTAPILPHAIPPGSTAAPGAVPAPTFQIPDMTKGGRISP